MSYTHRTEILPQNVTTMHIGHIMHLVHTLRIVHTVYIVVTFCGSSGHNLRHILQQKPLNPPPYLWLYSTRYFAVTKWSETPANMHTMHTVHIVVTFCGSSGHNLRQSWSHFAAVLVTFCGSSPRRNGATEYKRIKKRETLTYRRAVSFFFFRLFPYR
jgi:hypothetical protein